MIISKTYHYDFSQVAAVDKAAEFFCLVFTAVPAAMRGDLVSGNVLQLKVMDYTDIPAELENWKNWNNFHPFANAPLMTAAIKMTDDPQWWYVGFPLSLCREMEQEHEFAIVFDGVFWQIFCDGELMDQEYPIGKISVDPAGLTYAPNLHDVRFSDQIEAICRHEKHVKRHIPLQFYSPPGFNTWVGDVVTYTFNGRFYLFYLYDRHHHNSRRGSGAHHFVLMTSDDLVNWIDHGAVFELEAQWQTVGTGNAFEFDGKLHLSFGWHTERYKKDEECVSKLIYENIAALGHTGEIREEESAGLFPSGGSYAVSDDGLNFRKSGVIMHYLENPCIFVQSDRSLKLYQEFTWQSDKLGSWRCVDKNFPRATTGSFAKNNLDCPNLFSLGDWEYIQIGFCGFWGRPLGGGDAPWIDFVRKGWEPYDGANVPMIAEYRGRKIEGSWINGRKWASCLLMREILPLGSGRIGKRWLPEALPEFPQLNDCGQRAVLQDEGFTLLEMDVDPAQTVKIRFSGCGTPCEFHLDPAAGRASWITAGMEPVPSYREMILADPDHKHFREYSNTHWDCRDYTREQLIKLDKPFRLRVLVYRIRKNDSTIIDVEIAGIHTMADQRIDLLAEQAELLVPEAQNMFAAFVPAEMSME